MVHTRAERAPFRYQGLTDQTSATDSETCESSIVRADNYTEKQEAHMIMREMEERLRRRAIERHKQIRAGVQRLECETFVEQSAQIKWNVLCL